MTKNALRKGFQTPTVRPKQILFAEKELKFVKNLSLESEKCPR